MRRLRFGPLIGLLLSASAMGAGEARAGKTLEDFRYFRALSIDLQGRVPTRAEVAAFEKDGFDLDAWIDKQLQGPAYADRLQRVYLDLLRLEVGPAFQFVQNANVLRRQIVKDPNGKDIYVYFRDGQRRARPETDGTFCLTQAETGQQFPRNAPSTGTPRPVAQQVLDSYTRVLKPWWLYRDYKSQSPTQRFDAAAWKKDVPGFVPTNGLLVEPDGTQSMTVRVCAEETQAAPMGTVYVSGRTKAPAPGTPPPYGRLDFPPLDSAFATQNAGKPVVCHTQTAFSVSADCGCGVGLERCMPGAGSGFDNAAFTTPSRYPLGEDQALDSSTQAQSGWMRIWWGREAAQLLGYVFAQDRDFRDVLQASYSFVNGPLAQFYRDIAPAGCCGQGINFGYTTPDPLVDPAKLPSDLLPHDASIWKMIDRGTRASGLLTMPIFLTKYGTRRARAHVLWNAFACKDFIAGNVQLKPSTEPDLMKRDGCNLCHATLEPLAAYFTRIQESSWTYLPAASFPADNAKCAVADITKMSSSCKTYYDPAFTTDKSSKLRGAYASLPNVEAGPQGFAKALISSSDFERCAAQNVASSFLGRALTPDDAALQDSLAKTFVAGGYKMRAMVKALLKSDAYKKANNLTSTALRQGGGL